MCAERVLGIDLGGTRCRALLADTEGARHRTGHANGGNPGSDPAAALTGVARAVGAALEGTSPKAVRRVVLGAAGYAAVSAPSTARALAQVWAKAGLHCPVRVRPDCEVAFAAGTADPDGVVLVAGTGSMAARISDRSMTSRAGGYGWMLGDEGSGFWLGREAVRAALRVLELGVAPSGELACRVLRAVLGDTPPSPNLMSTIGAITTWVHREAPAGVAALAPLVLAAAQVGDAEATGLLDRAANLLADLALTLWRQGEPLVLAGSLLTTSRIGTLVRKRLRAAGVRVHHSGEPVAGAAWLAVLDIWQIETGSAWTSDPAAIHVRLIGAPHCHQHPQERRSARSPG
ncbi:MAG: N-acetylglucosamine kinase [Pseudonocardiaceae bacterium]